MKIAVISDIHSNLGELSRALNGIMRECESIICLGDIVGYGYNPSRCIELCRDNAYMDCLLGNHDAAVAGKMPLDWFSQTAAEGIVRDGAKISAEQKEWLARLPHMIKREYHQSLCEERTYKVCYAHGSYIAPSQFDYIHGLYEADDNLEAMEKDGIRLLFVGHTHEARAYVRDAAVRVRGLPSIGEVEVKKYNQVIVNVGSLGYPRVEMDSRYAVFDTGKMTVSFRSIPFKYSEYCDNMSQNGINLPSWLAGRMDELGN